MFRTKGQLMVVRKFSETLSDKIEEFVGEKLNVEMRDLWLENLGKIEYYTKYLIEKTWVLLESNNEFYISDNPVVFQNNTNNNELRGGLGINSIGIEIYIPLSSSLSLALFCNKTVICSIPNILCVPGHIIYLNSLQFNFSTRFIFSKTNNFELLYKIINGI